MSAVQWAYKVVEARAPLTEKQLNEIGIDFWELVAVEVTFNGSGNDQCRTYYFKKQIWP